MDRINFYSEHDLACGWELGKIVERLRNNDIDIDWSISELFDFYNILKYIEIERFSKYLAQETNTDLLEFSDKIRKKIGIFIDGCKREFLSLYDCIMYFNLCT